jgi:hypothetical protein
VINILLTMGRNYPKAIVSLIEQITTQMRAFTQGGKHMPQSRSNHLMRTPLFPSSDVSDNNFSRLLQNQN